MALGGLSVITWLFRRFWRQAPNMGSETQWNTETNEDAWEGVRYQLERIADALEHWRGLE